MEDPSNRKRPRSNLTVTLGLFVCFCFVLLLFVCVCVSFCLIRATPTAYGGTQARVPLRAVAAGLRHSDSNMGSELRLPPTP